MKKENQVTIFSASEFTGNINKYEGTLIDQGVKKYAQYESAPFVKFVPKGKRSPVGFINGYKPYLLILEGTGHKLVPQELFDNKNLSSVEGVTVKQARYSAFDEMWESDFDSMVDKYLEENPKVKVIADYRNTKGFDSYVKQPSLA